MELSFPELIDNTCRSTLVSCPQKWVYQNLYHLAAATPSIHLHAGGAFASGLEHARKAFFDDGKSPEESIKIGVEALISFWGDFETDESATKSMPRMVDCLLEYFLEYPLQSNPIVPMALGDGKHAIEFTFSVPLEHKHPVTGNPLMYAGRFDMLAEYNGTLFAVDEKTTAQLGQSWAKQWELDSQFTGYCWAAQQYGYPVGGALIRGISILKTKFGHAQEIIYRPAWQLERWYENLNYGIEQMLDLYDRALNGRFIPHALDKTICGNYGGCTFHRPCASPNPQSWLESEFVPRTWSPLHKGA
jgi:hypothetical protein